MFFIDLYVNSYPTVSPFTHKTFSNTSFVLSLILLSLQERSIGNMSIMNPRLCKSALAAYLGTMFVDGLGNKIISFSVGGSAHVLQFLL